VKTTALFFAVGVAATTSPRFVRPVLSPDPVPVEGPGTPLSPLDAPIGGGCVDVVHHERALVEGVGVVEHALTATESAEVLFRVALDRFCREEQARLQGGDLDLVVAGSGPGAAEQARRWRLQGIEDLEQLVYLHPDSEHVAVARLNIGVAWIREAKALDREAGRGDAAPVVDGRLNYGRFESAAAEWAAARGAAELHALVVDHGSSPAAPRAHFHLGLHNWLERRDLPAARRAMLRATGTGEVGPESLTIATYAGLLLMEAGDHANARMVLLRGLQRELAAGLVLDGKAQDQVEAVDALAWLTARTPGAKVQTLEADLEGLSADWALDRGLRTVVRAALHNDALVLAEASAMRHLARFPDHAEAPAMRAAVVGARVRAPRVSGGELEFADIESAADAFVAQVQPKSAWNRVQAADGDVALARADAAWAWHNRVVSPTQAHIERLFADAPDAPFAEPWWALLSRLVDSGHAALPDHPTALDDVAALVDRHLASGRPHLAAWLAARVFHRLGPGAPAERRRVVVETWAEAAGRAVELHFRDLDPSAPATPADHAVRAMYACALWSGWGVTGETEPALDAVRNLTLVGRPDLAEALLGAVHGASGPDWDEAAVEVERGLLIYRYQQGHRNGDLGAWCDARVQAPVQMSFQGPASVVASPPAAPPDLEAAARAHLAFARDHHTHPDAAEAAHLGTRYANDAHLPGLAEQGQVLMVTRFIDHPATPAHRVDLAVRYRDTMRLGQALTTLLDAATQPPPALQAAPLAAEAAVLAEATDCPDREFVRASLTQPRLQQQAPIELARLAEACHEDGVAADLYVDALAGSSTPDLAVVVALGDLLERRTPQLAELHWLEWDVRLPQGAVQTDLAAARVRLEAAEVRLAQLRDDHGLDEDHSRWAPMEADRRSKRALRSFEGRALAVWQSLDGVSATACTDVDARRLRADVAVVLADAFSETWVPTHLTEDQAVLFREGLQDAETRWLVEAEGLLGELHGALLDSDDPAVALCPGAAIARTRWAEIARRLGQPPPIELHLGHHVADAPFRSE